MRGAAFAAATMLSIGGTGGSVSAITTSDQWNSAAGVFVGGGGAEIDAMVAVGTDLYIAGSFTSIGGLPVGNIARFDGAQWSAVGDPSSDGPATSVANALLAVGTDLYVGGSGSVWKYDTVGQEWSDLAVDPDLEATALAWYDDGTNPPVLVAGGTSIGGDTCHLEQYDGSNWTTLGEPTLAMASPGSGGWNFCVVESLAVWNDDLYVGGIFDHVGLVAAYSIARFDGTSFHAVGSAGGNGVFEASMDGIDAIPVGDVITMTVNPAGTALVIGGGFTDVNLTIDDSDPSAILGQGTDRAENLAVWDGATLAPFGGSDDPTVFPSSGEWVSAVMFASDGSLYLVGGTTFPDDGYGVGRLTDPTGSDWTSLGWGVDDDALAVEQLGDSIWVGGYFTAAYADDAPTAVAGTATIARWGVPQVAPSITASGVTGTPVVGNTLTLSVTLRGTPAPVVTRQWLRCTDEVALAIAPADAQPRRLLPPGCVEISGAIGPTYVVQPADVGKYLVVVVMASNSLGVSAALPSTAVRATAAATTTTTTTTTQPSFVLPATGGSNGSISWTALVLVLTGLALFVPARRRWLR